MEAASSGNTEEVTRFMPMAIQAHEQARPLNLDGLYHLALLYQTAEDYASAKQTTQEMLTQDPDYLLGLSAAADAAIAVGDSATARQNYTHFLEVYDAQIAKQLEEYSIHQNMLTDAREKALSLTRP